VKSLSWLSQKPGEHPDSSTEGSDIAEVRNTDRSGLQVDVKIIKNNYNGDEISGTIAVSTERSLSSI
jgi:hypothetical protein